MLARSVPRDKLFLSVNVPLSRRQAELFAGGELDALVRRLDHVEPGPLPAGAALGSDNPPGAFAIRRVVGVRPPHPAAPRELHVLWEGYETPSWEPVGAFDAAVAKELIKRWVQSCSE